jgi:osmoprotectant transport system ATP-binding protein
MTQAPGDEYCVEFEAVAKHFDQVRVLENIRVGCPAGATTAIVGASGSGKTTMLQLVNGLLVPDQGEVRVFSHPVPRTNLEQFRRQMGYAVQGAGLFPHMTARENVVLIARLEGWTEADIEARFQALLQEMDLSADVGARYPRELSGGQQQRVGLCRALMLKPRLLLLDEPFSAVDPITRVEVYERFEFVQTHEGVSSLLVTHDLREARRLAEYLVILHQGRILQHGPTQATLSNPQHDYVRSLVDSQLS